MQLDRYPFGDDVEVKIIRPDGIYAHENFPESYYAVDFLLPIGTPILAADEGIVCLVKDDSDEWGLDPILATKANFVVINHGYGTHAEYIHFGKGKIVVKSGDFVNPGRLLGYSGYSGCMSEPHLHFNMFKIVNGRGVSIPCEFKKRA